MQSFDAFRVVGSICGPVPVAPTLLYGTPVLMVATGRTFQLYKGKELAMMRGGPTFADPVRAVAQAGKYRAVAEGPRLHVFVHHKPLWTSHQEASTKPLITHLLAQDDLLLSVGEDKRVVVWELKTGTMLQELLVEGSETVTCLALLSGYTNKLLLATAEGTLQLWNFRSGTCLWYSARGTSNKGRGSSGKVSHAGTAAAAITALACSRYKDIIAYGTTDGSVVVCNVAADEVITTFDHSDSGAVTSLLFRTDKDGLLVSGTSLGEVVVWDLENRCMDGTLTRSKQVRSEQEALERPHVDAVHSLVMFGAPDCTSLLITGSADNALMQFRFDTVDGLGVLVRERRGHMGSCTDAIFYNTDLLVTAGNDRALRVTHVFSDRASWELSQGKLGKRGREQNVSREAVKLPPATALAAATTRNYQWSSLVSLHTASALACGWRMDNRAMEFKLSGIQTSAHTARALALSDCGNYAVVGYSSGNVAVLSLQNRSVRHLFDPSLGADRAHDSSVECVEVACGNTIVVTAGLDGVIKMWDLWTGKLKASIATDQPMTQSCLHEASSLFIVAQHYTIRVYHANPDVGLTAEELCTPVRELEGHNSPVTALALAPDTYRYVASTSGDGALLVWDLAAAACVGQYRFASPALSLAFHPDALFLVTTHAGERGAYLWVNNIRYGFVPEVVPTPKANAVEKLPWLHFPTAHGAAEEAAEDGPSGTARGGEAEERAAAAAAAEERAAAAAEADLFDASQDIALVRRRQAAAQQAALDAIAMEGLQLAGVPQSVWFNLTVLDQIKEKNQPLLPPKKKDVPFFLPTTQELRPTFLVVASDNRKGGDAAGGDGKGRMTRADLEELTPVQEMLVNGQHDALMDHFLSLKTAQAIDLELKRVVDYVDGSEYTAAELERMQACLRGLLSFLTAWLRRGTNVDLVQGILTDVVRSHGALLTRFGDALVPALEELAEAQNTVRYSVDHLVSYPTCLAGTFSGTLF
ncbi:WD domain, G-beta repeat/Utp21 specific WD40 associated putative domain containing protein [Novymonas esmeraldas]|uniref:WD domain, G-beta repeat/Utp21 specific WD40 associated putative domain containing protein n=1 Tax=Novymonas esmeraldas TaxID=1808958 RepID=A0AAW0F3V3_9TRYP